MQLHGLLMQTHGLGMDAGSVVMTGNRVVEPYESVTYRDRFVVGSCLLSLCGAGKGSTIFSRAGLSRAATWSLNYDHD